jgi:hypothetical protein
MNRILCIALLVLAGAPAQAADRAAWQEECGSCHIAYPPALLPADSWRRIMASLDDHFGTDASLDAPRAQAIESFLVANARRSRGSASAPLRITETAWFRGEHREIPAARWRSPEVRTASNCGACHAGAAQGSFDDDDE